MGEGAVFFWNKKILLVRIWGPQWILSFCVCAQCWHCSGFIKNFSFQLGLKAFWNSLRNCRAICWVNDHRDEWTSRFCLVAFWDYFLYRVDLGNSVKPVNPEQGPLSWKFCATQVLSEGPQERHKSRKHQIFSLSETQVLLETHAMYEAYHIKFWDVWVKYIDSAFADETFIRKFLSSCAAEPKAWVIIPWAKELEYLD